MKNETIGMTQKDLAKYQVVKNLIAKIINGTDAAKRLALSVRQTKRLKARVISQGAAGIIHRLRNRASNHRTAPELYNKARELIEGQYPDFGPVFAHEKLTEVNGLDIGQAAVRNLMIKEKIWTPKERKKNKQYRVQRERKASYGEMIQFDGCYHIWFGDKEYCLLSGIDDATSEPVRLEFSQSESVQDVFAYWKEYIKKYGKPVAIYLDKFSTYKINHKNAKDNHELITQFQRACKEPWHYPDHRPQPAGQGKSGAAVLNFPGPVGQGITPAEDFHRRSGQQVLGRVLDRRLRPQVWR